MVDCVAIAPELSFRSQVLDIAVHLGRIVSAGDRSVLNEFMAPFDTATNAAQGEELSEEKKQDVVRMLVSKVTDANGGLEGQKENEAESSHLLLQFVLAENFDTASTEYSTFVKTVIQSVKVGAGNAAAAGRTSRVEVASRILNNTYNYLPVNSPLRPTTLLALLSVLALSSDLEALPLSSTYLTASLNQWAISQSEKIAFLTDAAEIYQSASLLSKALEINLVALNIEVSEQVAERAVALTLGSDKRFDLGEVLKTPGVTGQLKGKAAEVVQLFTDADELEAVTQGEKWAQDNSSYITGFGIPQFTSESLVRKLRLIALATLCARSASKQVSYSEVSQALSIPESEVEAWVIDAIRADLIKARLSQPASLVKVQSVSSVGSRRFGSTEWQTLERRLQEWKKSVSEARSVIAEAEAVAAQGPITHQRRGGGGGQQQQQQRRDEEVAA